MTPEVQALHQKIAEQKFLLQQYHEALQRLVGVCDGVNVSFANGVTDPTGTIDEGDVHGAEAMAIAYWVLQHHENETPDLASALVKEVLTDLANKAQEFQGNSVSALQEWLVSKAQAAQRYSDFKGNTSVIQDILKTCQAVTMPRSEYYVLGHIMEEVGELATEVNIAVDGRSYKQQGADGVIGEAVDAIICLVDMVYIHLKNQGLPSDDIDTLLKSVAKAKLEKWLAKAKPYGSK